jgi:hypothetical protein
VIFSPRCTAVLGFDMKTVHRISFPLPARVDHLPLDDLDAPNRTRHGKQRNKLHWLRDGDAGTFYVGKLAAAGYEFSLELNLPAPAGAADSKADRGAAAAERLKKGDILLVNNRPPLTPDANQLLAPIKRSESWVEDRIMEVLNRIFTACCRDEIVLSAALAAMLPPTFEKRAKVKFKTRPEAEYSHRASLDGEYEEIHTHRTAGYLIYVLEIWPNGPDLLCSFAMSGPMNLVWAFLVATLHADRIMPSGQERIFMADIVLPVSLDGGSRVFPDWPATLDFARSWDVQPTLDRQASKLLS